MNGTHPARVAAVDLGADSGRVMLAEVGPERLHLTEVHRFANRPVRVRGTLHWDILALFGQTVTGLRAAAQRVAGDGSGSLDSAGIDSWAVDYGLLDAGGELLGNPVHYRDARTNGVMERVVAACGATELYQTTGLQLLPFNTLFQLVAESSSARLAAARRLLLIPDLLSYWLTGTDPEQAGSELTNASTTQLLDVRTRAWATGLIEAAGIPAHLFGPLRAPGEPAGTVLAEYGAGAIPVTTVASHDTASAVAAMPIARPESAYISCGTWSLVGMELAAPVLTEASRLANLTNETGVDGTVRYLRNVMGLWLLQESLRSWRSQETTVELEPLLAAAAAEPALTAVVDAADPRFLAPGEMPARIAAACRRTGQPVPHTPPQITRVILDSLALAHRATVRELRALTARPVEVVHMVGGGARNRLLCQLTADACQAPVVAGPVEATALGNALVQARTLGVIGTDLAAMRRLVRDTQSLDHYQPTGGEAEWRAAGDRIGVVA